MQSQKRYSNVHLKEKNKLFLSCEYQKKYHPSPKTAQLSKSDSNQNFISPLRFKKLNYIIRLFSNYVDKWGVACCVVAVMVMIHNYYSNTLWLETLVDICLGP